MGLLKTATDAAARAKEQGQQVRQAADAAAAARAQRDSNPVLRWEYRTCRVGSDKQRGMLGSRRMETIFNQLGSQGWELVAVNMERATFKRPVPQMSSDELEAFAVMPEVPEDAG